MKIRFLLSLTFVCQSLLGGIDKSTWKLVDVSSENLLTGELARYAFDDDPETQWHSRWHDARESEAAQPPHQITVDLGSVHSINGVRLRTRAHGEGGFPREFKFEVSREGHTWTLAAKGQCEYRSRFTAHASIFLNTEHGARYFRLTIDSVYPNRRARDEGLVISEIDITTPESPFTPTTVIPVPASREWNYQGYHWQTRHRALLAHANNTKGNLVFIGDSITHRWGAAPFDNTPKTGKTTWDHYYQHREPLNLGYGWDRIENMIWRIEHGELDEVDPTLVVMMAGTNNLEVNTPEEIAVGIRRLCHEIHRRKPRAQLLLLAVFPRGQSVYPPALVTLNGHLSRLAELPYVEFKDIGHVFLNEQEQLTREIMPDLLHPGAEGYRRWAQAIEPEVSRILEDTPITPIAADRN